MSQQSPSAQPPTPPGVTLNPEIISVLAEKLQDFTQALLALGRQDPPTPTPPDAPPTPKEPDQIRCYRVPGFIVRCERETLEQHQVPDLVEFLRKARNDFHLTSVFLQNFPEDSELNGFFVQQVGERLAYPINMLNELCSIFADYKPHPEQERVTG